jgi:hypothetical protein
MLPVAEAATRALARQQAENLTRFLRQERTLSAQLVALATTTVGAGDAAASKFLVTYIDEMAAALAGSDVFDPSDGGKRLEAMLTSLAQGLAGALAEYEWAGPVIERAIAEARSRHVPGAPPPPPVERPRAIGQS